MIVAHAIFCIIRGYMDSMSGASRQCSFNPMELPQSGLEPCGVSGISKEELYCSLRDDFYAHIPFEIEPT